MTSTARPSVAQCSIWAVTERCVLFASSFARASSLSEIFTGAVTPGTVHDATDVARRHAHARVVAQALDLAGVAARHHPQALVDDSEPDRRAHLGAIAPKRREAYVALARELGEGHWRLARDLGVQLADARGDDVDKPVDLGGGDTEGRREAHDLAARVDDRAALPRLAGERGDFRGREPLARAGRPH